MDGNANSRKKTILNHKHMLKTNKRGKKWSNIQRGNEQFLAKCKFIYKTSSS